MLICGHKVVTPARNIIISDHTRCVERHVENRAVDVALIEILYVWATAAPRHWSFARETEVT